MNRATAYLLFLFYFFIALPTIAQDKKLPERLVTVHVKDRPFPEALAIIESRISYKFAYSTEVARGQKNISIEANGMPLTSFLDSLFRGSSLSYRIIGDQIILQKIALSSRVTISGIIKAVSY